MAKTGFKIFMGTQYNPADWDINDWLDEHPEVEVVDFKYQQTGRGENSICIMYKVED